jgi:processive 1,2-diacylglycerol beta-glucosyltransferase
MKNRPTGPMRTLGERKRLAFERFAMRRLTEQLLARRPALIVCTHFLMLPILGRLVSQCDDLRTMTVVTDNEAHRYWYGENVSRYFVPSARVAGEVQAWGIPAERVTVTGIPVHPKWTAPQDRARIFADWKLPADKPIVVLSGGTYFTVGPIPRIAQMILAQTDAHVLVLCGSNKDLLGELARLPQAGGDSPRLTAVPFTQKLPELLEVASLMVTKPGGMTVSECMAKGVAMVLTPPVPGQESANARMLTAAGAAVVAGEDRLVATQVVALLKQPQRLETLRRNARALYKPATETICDEILKALERFPNV